MKHYQTEGRRRLLSFFEEHPDRSFSMDELCSVLCPDGHGQSTLYRLVKSLVDERVLSKSAEGSDGRLTVRLCRGDCTDHLHLKCTSCGQLIHLDGQASHSLEHRLRELCDFELDGEHTLLFGRCADCKTGGASHA